MRPLGEKEQQAERESCHRQPDGRYLSHGKGGNEEEGREQDKASSLLFNIAV